MAVGRHGVIGAEQARQRVALIIDRIKRGEDPTPKPPEAAPTVSALAGRFMRVHAGVRCKPDTAAAYRSVVRKHIVPALGSLPIAAVERAQVAELRQRLSGTPQVANIAVRTLSLMYRLAGDWGLAPDGLNPCRAIVKYNGRRREGSSRRRNFVAWAGRSRMWRRRGRCGPLQSRR